MQIAVASGKGGTGKTTVATSLASSLADGRTIRFLDCDVEAPNGHLFLKPDFVQQAQAVIRVPHIQENLCSRCGKCVEVCQFHALAKVGKSMLVFPQLCHGCGSCTRNCPEGAIDEVPNPIGVLEAGIARGGIYFSRGLLTVSEPMPTPVIRQLKQWFQAPEDGVVILDSPPGASCSVVQTLHGVDYVLLVTEPTPFGLHDLKQMVGILQEMDIPSGVIINRQNDAYLPLVDFCAENQLPVLMTIPYDRLIAEGIAQGKTLIEIYPEYSRTFQDVFEQVALRIHEKE